MFLSLFATVPGQDVATVCVTRGEDRHAVTNQIRGNGDVTGHIAIPAQPWKKLASFGLALLKMGGIHSTTALLYLSLPPAFYNIITQNTAPGDTFRPADCWDIRHLLSASYAWLTLLALYSNHGDA